MTLLLPPQPGQLDPETVAVDIGEGRYYAATVRYPKKVSFGEARRSLNTLYGKYEKIAFADNPSMGLWRNEAERVAIQLTEDERNLVVVYITISAYSAKKHAEVMPRVLQEAAKDATEP